MLLLLLRLLHVVQATGVVTKAVLGMQGME
jgi:hypothetical protein